ncbi:MAG: hypothetical protein IKI38_04395 [Mogibacterium sp.]|nr:hypothetical protein [Mogibacterium sp.]
MIRRSALGLPGPAYWDAVIRCGGLSRKWSAIMVYGLIWLSDPWNVSSVIHGFFI